MPILPTLVSVALLSAAPVHQRQEAALTAQLKAKTQGLLDAVAPGDIKPWKSLADPDLLFVTENNEVLSKSKFLEQFEPLPKGLVGNIKVTDFQLRLHGDAAVTTYVADETLDYHGQILKTKFRTSDTWYRTGGKWTMISSMTLAVLNDPPAIKLPAAMLADYAGEYELTPEIHYTVRAQGNRLFGQRDGGKEVELLSESPDLFFVAGSPRSRRVFYRNVSGKVAGFGDRREGQDIKWKRTS